LAVLNNVLTTNPVRDVQSIRSKGQPKGATALTVDQLRERLTKVRESEVCQRRGLVDPITLLVATGLDYDDAAGTLAVTGKMVRQRGTGLVRVDETKTDAGRRTLALPAFAIMVLRERRCRPFLGEQDVIFPSTAATLRDPDNFGGQWREARSELEVPDVSTFRKTIATLIDDEGLSARIGADHLGHARVSMAQDRYMSCGHIHPAVAALMDRTVAKPAALNGE
jgi:integrase